MSWMKRPRGSPAPVTGPGQNIYNPTQPPLPGVQPVQQPTQWTGQQPAQPPPTQANYPQQQQYWQQPAPAAYNNQAYPQPNYQQQQPPQNQYQNEYYQYDQQYQAQQGYPQQGYQTYPNQPFNPHAQQAPPNPGVQTDADPWDWGWQEDPNAQQSTQKIPQQNANQQINQPQNTDTRQQINLPQQNPTNNANILADSFANSGDSWNWAQGEPARQPVGDPTQNVKEPSHDSMMHIQKAPSPKPPGLPHGTVDSGFTHNVSREMPHDDNKNVHFDSVPDPMAEPTIKTLNDREALREHNIPNLAVGRRFHSDNLTPQWSIESQPSQDSSDGILSHTESTNRSDDPSRSSNKSSPGFNTNDNTNFNYAHPVENVSDSAWENSYIENTPNSGHVQGNVAPENSVNQELIHSVRTMSINRESVSPDKSVRNMLSDGSIPSHSLEHNVLPPQVSTPPLANVPLPPSNKTPQLPPNMPGLPPTGSSNQNPFKRAGQLSHRSANRGGPMPMMPPPDNAPALPIDYQSSPISQQEQMPLIRQPSPSIRQPSPGLANTQNIPTSTYRNAQVNYSTANLETTPDNSERPDIPPPVNYRPIQYPHSGPVHQNIVENFEVAPNNDRNEYMQTGHLSDATYDNTNFADDDLSRNAMQENYPPPGFKRMVLGQPETEFGQNSSFTSDEPPPGLSRMVPGQLTDSNMYAQPNDDYLDRQIDGQTTESDSLNNSTYMNRAPAVYRQVDGQPTDDESNYNTNISSRSASDRRPVGLDRMVPGESSSFSNVQNFQSQSFGNISDERVVPGFGQSNATEPREQNMDGSDYSEVDANQIRSVVGAVEIADNPVQNLVMEPEMVQRDLDMEGENLQDLSAISSADFPMVRDQNMDGADIQDQPVTNRTAEVLDSGSERHSNQKQTTLSRDPQHPDKDRKYRDDTTGDESERDRIYKRKEKERLKSSKERDTRYSDRRDERRSDKDRRGESSRADRERDDRYRRSNRDMRYETEDTDYSDRDRRRYRESSYPSGKPPRPEPSTRRDEDGRRSHERYARGERDGRRRDDRERRDERDGGYARDDRGYARDDRGYGSVRKNRVKDERKRDPRYPPRPDSRDPDPTEDELNETAASVNRDRRSADRERDRDGDRSRAPRHRRDRGYNQQYYDRYGYSMDPYAQQMYQHQQQTYQYYEKLRLSNPQAYLEIYNKYMAEGYSSMPGYESASTTRLGDERASVHSGRSSANGENNKDRSPLDSSSNYYYAFRRTDPTSAYRQPARRRGSGSLRTDHSGSRDFNTDASINLHALENSTVKSDRMTPVKFATAHIKGVLSSTNLVTVNPSYPVDGQPAIVEILDINKILLNDPVRCELTAYPGPLIKGVTHKKTVIEYCEMKIRDALDSLVSPPAYQERSSGLYQHHPSAGGGSTSERQTVSSSMPANADLASYVLMWELLILLLRQNGMVVGTDIAELLVKNKRQFEWRGPGAQGRHHSRRGSTSSVTSRSAEMPVEEVPPNQDILPVDGAEDSSNDASLSARRTDPRVQNSSAARNPRRTSSNTNILESSSQEKFVTDRFREYLLFGSGKEALEWAMNHGLWGHALFLASKLDRRTYANVMTRFANGLAANDPLQTLYQLMSGRQPASVTCILDEKWGDWRPHLAMILSNTSQRPELDRKSITTLGDTLQSRGDTYGAHFCYLMAREEFLPTRLQLLGLPPPLPAPSRTPSHALIMTEIYEYACTLSQDSHVLGHFQFYKYILATRLVDCGLYERALLYMESIASVVVQTPDQYQASFIQRVLEMAERLKYFDPEENVGELPDDGDQYGDGQLGHGRGEKVWVTNMKRILTDLNTGAMHEPPSNHTQSLDYSQPPNQPMQENQFQQSSAHQQWNQGYQQPNYDQFQLQHHEQQNFAQEDAKQPEIEGIPQMYDPGSVQNTSYLTPLAYQGFEQSQGHPETEEHSYGGPVSSSDSGYWNHDQQPNYGYNEDREAVESLEPPRPQISMPNASLGRQKSLYDEDLGDQRGSAPQTLKQPEGQKQPAKKETPGQTGKNQSAGWFGGIFNKLTLKPKNQMILPDDKNPSIVWDSDNKKWVNLDADEDEQQSQLTLPPKMSDILRPAATNNNVGYQPIAAQPSQQTPPPSSNLLPPLDQGSGVLQNMAPTPNIFKLQKGRHIKKSYVDVFNPSGAPIKPLPPASEVLGASVQTVAPTSYFVPGATNNNSEQGAPSFYNPANY